LPASPERSQQELTVQTVLGAAVIATDGWAAPEVARAYGRARELCMQPSVTPQLFPIALGLTAFYLMRGELRTAREMSEQLSAVAETTDDAALLLGAYNAAGLVAWHSGEPVVALAHFERAMEIYDRERHSPDRFRAFSLDHDPAVSHVSHAAWALSALGYPDRAAARMRQCLDHARAIDHPVSLVIAYTYAEVLYHHRRDVDGVRAIARELAEHVAKHGLDRFLDFSEIYRGWLLAEDGHGDEGIALIQRVLATCETAGVVAGMPTFLGVLAEVCEKRGRVDDGLAAVTKAARPL
jgi:predicted ATPase